MLTKEQSLDIARQANAYIKSKNINLIFNMYLLYYRKLITKTQYIFVVEFKCYIKLI